MNHEPSSDGTLSTPLSGATADRRFSPGKGRVLLSLLSLLLLLPTVSSPAEPYALDWWTSAAGCGTSGGGTYALSGMIGQTDCTVMSGGGYCVDGGFWPGLTIPSNTDVPTLAIQIVNDHARISWSPATPGFTLEQTEDLSAPNWIPAPAGNPVIVPMSAKTQFFRLRSP